VSATSVICATGPKVKSVSEGDKTERDRSNEGT
jgi:hypothetical protein